MAEVRPGSYLRRPSSGRGQDRDLGMAMLAVLMAVLVVVGLGVVAVQDTVSGISQSTQGSVLVQTVDAAEAGIQAELAKIQSYDSTTPYQTQIACANGAVTVASASNRAGDSSYTLSMTLPSSTKPAPPFVPPGSSTPGTTLYPCSTNPEFTVPSGSRWVLVQSTGSTVASTNEGVGRTLQALISVGENPGGGTTPTTGPPAATTTTTTTVPSAAYDSAASAKALNLGGLIQPYNSTPISAANDGSDSNTPVTAQGALSPPPADGVVAPQQSLVAEANTSGSSYSCASVLSSGDVMSGGSVTTPCTTSGSTVGGSINFLTLPVVGSSLSSLVASMSLNFSSVTSWATGNAGGTSFSGSSTIVGASVTVKLLLGIISITTPVTLPSPLSGSTDILAATLKAILNDPLLGSALSSTLSGVLTPVISVTGGYHSLVNGVFTQSGLHLAFLNDLGVTADLAMASVGPNTTNTPVTTTTIPAVTTTLPAATTTTLQPPPVPGVTVVSIRQCQSASTC